MFLRDLFAGVRGPSQTSSVVAPPAEVDCSERPYDLRPALQAITSAENWFLERIPAEQTLVVLIGEDHPYQSHTFLQTALLKDHARKLQEKEFPAFAFGIEVPNNILQNHNERTEPSSDPHSPERHLDAIFGEQSIAPSTKMFLQTCSEQSISVNFNDIATKDLRYSHSVIDQTDQSARAIVRKYYSDLKGKAVPREFCNDGQEFGIKLSNLAIVENAINHMQRPDAKGTRIYIQNCGALHVTGLTDLFQKRGFAVLPVFLSFDDEIKAAIPESFADKLEQSVRISGLAPARQVAMTFDEAKKKIERASKLNL